MITRYFIVEGQFDKFILEKVLPPEIVSQSKFIIGNGYNTAISKARSLLVSSELPIALVIDSETTDISSVAEKKDFIIQSLSQLSNPEHFQIFVAVPEIEILFFHERGTLEKIVQEKVLESQWEFAKYRPKEVLNNLLKTQNLQEVLNARLTPDIVSSLRNTDFIQMIIKSVNLQYS